MKLTTALNATDAYKEFLRFFKNTGHAIWEKKIAKLESLPLFPHPSPNFYRNYLVSRNPLTKAIAAFLKLHREGKLLRKHATDELMRTCGYLRVCNALFHAHPDLSQKIKANLINDETVRSFLFELDIAIHFLRLGLDVRFVDLESMQRFDLLISDGESELEVECKTKSADAGRKITLTNFNLLCDVLAAEWLPIESIAVLLKCDGRLTGSQNLFHKLASEIKRVRANQEHIGKIEELSFEIRTLQPGTAIKTDEEAAAALKPYWSANNTGHYSVISGPQTLIIACESTSNNRVLASIYPDLRNGARQLSGTRPSLLACQIEEIDDQDWDKLRIENGGLALLTRKLFTSSSGPHINYIVYSSTRTPPLTNENFTDFTITYLRFANQSAAYPFPKSFLAAPFK